MPKPANHGLKLPGEPMTRDHVHRLLRATGRGFTGARDRALITLLYRSGLRIAEALDLVPANLDPEAGLVHVASGKGGKPRSVGMDPEAFAAQAHWLDVRSRHRLNGHSKLFCTHSGKPLDAAHFRRSLKRLRDRASITDHRVHPHAFRHGFAIEFLRDGHPLNELQKQLGHSSLEVTSRYVNHVTNDDLASTAKNRPSWTP